jgi:hypothetical protein
MVDLPPIQKTGFEIWIGSFFVKNDLLSSGTVGNSLS